MMAMSPSKAHSPAFRRPIPPTLNAGATKCRSTPRALGRKRTEFEKRAARGVGTTTNGPDHNRTYEVLAPDWGVCHNSPGARGRGFSLRRDPWKNSCNNVQPRTCMGMGHTFDSATKDTGRRLKIHLTKPSQTYGLLSRRCYRVSAR